MSTTFAAVSLDDCQKSPIPKAACAADPIQPSRGEVRGDASGAEEARRSKGIHKIWEAITKQAAERMAAASGSALRADA